MTDAQEIKGEYDKFMRLPFKIYSLPEDEYEMYGINRKYYSLSAAEAEKLTGEGKLIFEAEGLAIPEEVSTERSKDGFWMGYYNVYDE